MRERNPVADDDIGEALGAAIVDGGLFSHLHEDHEPEIRAWIARG